jgi:hypothetical protein
MSPCGEISDAELCDRAKMTASMVFLLAHARWEQPSVALLQLEMFVLPMEVYTYEMQGHAH